VSPCVTQFPRAVRPVPEPLGHYVHVGRNDHKALLDLIASGDAALFGSVLDPTLISRHGELRDQVLAHKMDLILNPKTQESATAGGYKEALGSLPWGKGRVHTMPDFEGTSGRTIAADLAQFALDEGFTQVMAPTHVVRAADDPWLSLDVQSSRRLREQPDRKGGARVPVIYPLAIPYKVLRDTEERHALIEAATKSNASAIWLQVDGAGSSGSASMVRNYINAATEMHAIGIPLIADHIGGLVGMSLLAFGAVGGIAHGVTLGERFDTKNWRQPSDRPFMPSHRVYIRSLDLMLDKKQAGRILSSSPKIRAHFGCNDSRCCPRGVLDMIEHPARHFMYQRAKEISELSAIPELRRPQHFLEHRIRPASDMAVRATSIEWEDPAFEKKMQQHRKRLDSLRVALSAQLDANPQVPYALHPERRATRESRNRA